MDPKRGWVEKEISGCSLMGFINQDGGRVDGEAIIQSIGLLNERSNSRGGGFAGYGIYPEMRDRQALHLIYEDLQAKGETEKNSPSPTLLAECFLLHR